MEARRACAFAWTLVVALAVFAWIGAVPLAVVAAWLFALPVIFCTSRATRGAHDERLDLPLAYRTAAGAALAVPLAGALLAVVPGHSDISSLFAVYFMAVAFFAYRAVVATGPRRALAAMTTAQLLGVPFLFLAALASMGCKCGPYRREPPWTDRWTLVAFLVTQLVAAIAAGVAPIAFHPRDEDMPEARLVA